MSVKYRTYVLYGVVRKGIVSEEIYDCLEGLFAEDDDTDFTKLQVLYDGMSGEYVAMGFIYARSNKCEGFGEIVKLLPLTPDIIADCVANVIHALPQQEGEDTLEFGWHVISHYY